MRIRTEERRLIVAQHERRLSTRTMAYIDIGDIVADVGSLTAMCTEDVSPLVAAAMQNVASAIAVDLPASAEATFGKIASTLPPPPSLPAAVFITSLAVPVISVTTGRPSTATVIAGHVVSIDDLALSTGLLLADVARSMTDISPFPSNVTRMCERMSAALLDMQRQTVRHPRVAMLFDALADQFNWLASDARRMHDQVCGA